MAIRAVVFDVFGTLVQLRQRRHPFRALQTLMESTGRTRQPTDAVRIMTNNVGLAGAAALLGADISARDIASLELDLLAELESARLFPEVESVLHELRGRGLRLGICSNLAAPYALPVRLLLPYELDAYAWSFELGVIKPEPLIYSVACSQLQCDPSDVLMVGDTMEADVEGPRRMGMQSLLLNRGSEAEDGGTISNLSMLLGIIDASRR